MYHRTFFLSLLAILLLISPFAMSAEISEQEALSQARAFLTARGRVLPSSPSLKRARSIRGQAGQGSAAYYIFNVADSDGFVVVSGDDRTPAILGYADSGSLDVNHLPSGLRYWLEGYELQIRQLGSTNDESAVSSAQYTRPWQMTAARKPITPMLSTQWNQGAPYNNKCPDITYTQKDGTEATKRSVTGCVATAMAQVMYYHQFPTSPTSPLPAYTTKDRKVALDALPATTTLDWSAMSKTYSSTASGAAADAVAKLMQYCGWSLQMDYNIADVGGSSAYNVSIAEALKTYFGYASGISWEQRNFYTYQDWVALIYGELAAGRPVVLGGQSAGGGHSFVCDGYDYDDYFHINWGWGGASDGYFRLSALNAEEQGIGGSSTLDGFSYSQEAVIGIKPGDGSGPIYRLGLEACHFGSPYVEYGELTCTRTSAEEDFAAVPIYFTIWSYQFAAMTYDYAIQLVDEDDRVLKTLYAVNDTAFNAFNTPNKVNTNVSFGTELEDGTYYLQVVCRQQGTDAWTDCYATRQSRIRAVVAGNDLTLSAPFPETTDLTCTAMTVSGNRTVGYEQEVVVSITGGRADYHGNLFLYVDDKMVMGKEVDIPAGKNVQVRFVYTPQAAGSQTLNIRKKRGGERLQSEAVTITDSDASNALALTFDGSQVDNLDAGGHLYGNAFRATVVATNPSKENTYVGTISCSVRAWTLTDVGGGETLVEWVSTDIDHQPLEVPKEGSTTVHFAFDNLQPNTLYSFRVTYQKSDTDSKVEDAIHFGLNASNYGSLTCSAGYTLGAADGSTTVYPFAESIDAGDAAFVDLRAISDPSVLTNITATNPNALYLLASGTSVPDCISGRNTVVGDEAGQLTLVDGYPFFTPVGFTATSASYARTFSLAANGSNGWNTLLLPFDVSEVRVDDGTSGGKLVDWFHSADDSGKNFWLKEFTGDADHAVFFDFAGSLDADIPYIIAVPDDRWGADWQMTDKEVRFLGQNVFVEPTLTATVSGDHYRFCGSTAGLAGQSAFYPLNDDGSSFAYQAESLPVAPFRAWMEATAISSLSSPALSIASGRPADGIQQPSQPTSDFAPAAFFDLSGRRVIAPARLGLYIHGGRKIFVR